MHATTKVGTACGCATGCQHKQGRVDRGWGADCHFLTALTGSQQQDQPCVSACSTSHTPCQLLSGFAIAIAEHYPCCCPLCCNCSCPSHHHASWQRCCRADQDCRGWWPTPMSKSMASLWTTTPGGPGQPSGWLPASWHTGLGPLISMLAGRLPCHHSIEQPSCTHIHFVMLLIIHPPTHPPAHPPVLGAEHLLRARLPRGVARVPQAAPATTTRPARAAVVMVAAAAAPWACCSCAAAAAATCMRACG